jgi:adenine/guanine phosphoribosyltransferase-like PRPP-binding protein
MAALTGMTGLLAHGGTAGAIVELVLVAGVVAIMLAVWVGNRRDGKERRD